ncbi:MAG: hypothetical protein ACRDJ1_04955 [Actinomycetota bacterium]
MARRAPEPYHADEWTGKIEKFIHASLGLEMNGLIAKDGGGRRWLTAEGEQAAAKIAV